MRAGRRALVQAMLRDVELAREDAQFLAEAQARGAFLVDLDSRKQRLQARLNTIRNHDPRYALVSIGALAVTVQRVTKRMPALALPAWNVAPGATPTIRAEYVHQLRDQQDGLNSMTVDQWEANRASYTTTGRSVVGGRLQALFGARTPRAPGEAAPHNPDQVAGGFDDPTGRPANFDVNSHIGSQWPTRVTLITTAVSPLTDPEKLITQMNVRLTI
jgi:hypothetical protein